MDNPWWYQIIAGYFGTITVAGTFANLIVIIVLMRHMYSLQVPDIFILSISAGDLLASAIAVPMALHALVQGSWPFGLTGCQFHAFLIYLLGVVSCTHLGSLAFEKYLTIERYAYSSGHFFSKTKACVIVGCLWLYSLLFSVAPVFGWARYGLENGNITCALRWDDDRPSDKAYYACMFIGVFFVPLGLMLFSYYNIFKVKKKVSEMTMQCIIQMPEHKRAALTQQIAFALRLLLLIGAYLVAWTPYAVVTLLLVTGHDVSLPGLLLPSLFAKSSFMLNPIMYTFISKKFRHQFTALFTCDKNRVAPE